jgi:hypothetical protein
MPLDYHEPREQLPESVIDEQRAITSLIEELEAVSWYNQRASVTQNAELKAILEHNRREETEHAMMLLEWLRRNYTEFDEQIQTYLNTTGDITELEEADEGGDGQGDEGSADNAEGSLNIGSLKQKGN